MRWMRPANAEEVPLAELKRGDLLLIRPGTSISADGVVRDGTSAVNESMITGESAPVTKRVGRNGDRRERSTDRARCASK